MNKQLQPSLDLSKSADREERFRTRRVIPWEVVLVFFYFAVPVSLFVGLEGAELNALFESYSLSLWLSLCIYLLFGVVLFYAISMNLYVKQDYDRRRSILVGVFEGSDGAHLITDNNQTTIYANSAIKTLLQRQKKIKIDDLLSLTVSDEDRERLQQYIQDVREGIEADIIIFPTYDIGEEGLEQRWFQLHGRNIGGWAGYRHWRLDNITDDFSEREELYEDRRRLIDFMDNAPVGFFSVNGEGSFTYANDTFIAWIAGEDIDLFDGDLKLHDILAEPPESVRPYDLIGNDGKPDHFQRGELKMKGYDGRVFLASVIHTIMDDGETISTRSIVRDLTPERAWKRALKQSEDRFQRFFEEAPLGISLVDKEGRISECNDAFTELIGEKYHDLIGDEFINYIIDSDKKKLERIIKQSLDKKASIDPVEITLKREGNSEDPETLQVFASSYMGDTGVVLHFIDLTEKKNLEKQFTQSQKMQAVGQLAGGIAHDFNNLLTAMIGFCDLLLSRHVAGDPSFGDIMQIKQNANRAANLVRQLLAFSRRQTLQPKRLDLRDVVTDVSHLLRRLMGANIELKIDHARELWETKVDLGQIEQVLINLVVNARDAMKETGGVVTIETLNKTTKRKKRMGTEDLPNGEWVLLKVTDTGTGIPDEILERIFDPFFTTKGIGEGTGLGLSTVYGIVRQTNGYIGVDTKIGKGTTFNIYLPRYDETQDHDADENASEQATESTESKTDIQDLTGTAKILLVEDEEAVRSFSSRALQNKGYEVIEADCAETALELIKEDKPHFDLLITDVIMPNMDGIEMISHIEKDYPDLPTIVMSGYTEDKFKDTLGDNVSFLSKPFTLKVLAEKVKSVLEDNA